MILQGQFLRNNILLVITLLLTFNIVETADELEYADYTDDDEDYSTKSCICVPYYKCRAIREDGAGIISVRYVNVQY